MKIFIFGFQTIKSTSIIYNKPNIKLLTYLRRMIFNMILLLLPFHHRKSHHLTTKLVRPRRKKYKTI